MKLSSLHRLTKGTCAASKILVSCMILACWLPFQMAAQASEDRAGQRPVLFLGNASLPPMNYMKQGIPTGVVIDLARALATRMPQPVEVQLMAWSEAQQRVLEGNADALLQINATPDRLKIYDFSDPLLTSEFTIFTSADRLGVNSLDDLRGLRVGVEEKGLPISLIKEDRSIHTVIIPDFLQGMKLLEAGGLDAVIADRWVGSYVLAENNIEGVRLVQEPVARSQSAIAVKRGNAGLLGAINIALAGIRRDGTYDRIIKSWRSSDVVFRTRQQLREQAWLMATVTGALIVALVCVGVLVKEIRRRRSVEMTLRAMDERFRLFMDNSPTIAWMKDEEGRHVYLNKTFENRFGVRLEDWRGKNGAELWSEEVIEKFRKHDLSVLASGQTIQLVEEAANPDGSLCYWLTSKFPFVDAAGSKFVAGVGIDITERMMTEEALRQSEERYRLLVETANEGIWSMDGEHVTTYVNQAMADMLGYSTVEMVGCKVEEFFFPEDGAFPNERMSRRHAGEGEIYERRFRRRDGSELWTLVSAKALKDEHGRFLGSFAMFIDITERKRAQESLRESQAKLEAALASIVDAVLISDAEGRFLDFNEAFATFYRFRSKDECRKTLAECPDILDVFMADGEPAPPDTRAVPRALRGETATNVEYTLRRKDTGETWSGSYSFAPIRGHDGAIVGSVVVGRDITEQKKAEIALRNSLEEKVSLLKEVHHRVKNNLQIVASLLGLQMGRSANQEARDVLQDTRNRVKSMALLHETLYRAGNLALIDFPAYVKDLCGQLMASFGEKAKGIILVQRVEPIDLPLDHAVPCGLIVNELVSNALKHGFPHSRTGRVVVGLAPDRGHTLILSVEDNGVGLPPGCDTTRSPTLGLQLVTRLAAQLKGRVEGGGAPGPGAVFRVIFPKPVGSTIDSES